MPTEGSGDLPGVSGAPGTRTNKYQDIYFWQGTFKWPSGCARVPDLSGLPRCEPSRIVIAGLNMSLVPDMPPQLGGITPPTPYSSPFSCGGTLIAICSANASKP